jgi:hypothetical protein
MANDAFDMGGTAAPENKEREFLTPGYRKLTVNKFEYTPAEAGKTPLILMKATGTGASGDPVEFTERLYISGKLNKDKVMSSIVRLQELYKGLTGNEKITIQPSKFEYTKDGTKYTIPNPQELCDFLNTTCTGITRIFKIGGEKNEEGKIFTKLTYSGFLYYTDKQGSLHTYPSEADFSEQEYKFAVQTKKTEGAPAGNGAVSSPSALDDL